MNGKEKKSEIKKKIIEIMTFPYNVSDLNDGAEQILSLIAREIEDLFWDYHKRWEKTRADSIYLLKEGMQTVLELIFDIGTENFKRR